MKKTKRIVIGNNDVPYECFYDGYINLDSIADGLNDERTKFIVIGNFIVEKANVCFVLVEEIEVEEDENGKE